MVVTWQGARAIKRQPQGGGGFSHRACLSGVGQGGVAGVFRTIQPQGLHPRGFVPHCGILTPLMTRLMYTPELAQQ